MDGSMIALFAAVLIIALLIILIMLLTKKGGMVLDVEKYRTKWLAIEQSLVRDNEASYHLAVMNADKLLDTAMRERGIKGQTMGDRLKFNKNAWSNRNSLWEAHKLRNQIAHESDVRVSYDHARRALAGFKQALKDVGAI